MTKYAIQVESLSKIYRIGLKEQMSETLGGLIGSWIRAPVSNFRRLRRLTSFDSNEYSSEERFSSNDLIWALSNVSFNVESGEVVGIIGRNGAGKSTLLKIISRITEPTHGRIIIHGRVSSLLEVGTGFHPELTGRENVYLNGVILGMTKAEIDRKFDEIVNFAEVTKFLDTPVKHYSSGMKVRLAFAVAAHLEPEILLVDEVLAVGDAAFQKKCLGKMEDVTKQGRTVLFVSHNMGAVETLCNRAVLLNNGRIERTGPTKEVISDYLARNFDVKSNPFQNCKRSGNGKIRVTGFHLEDQKGKRVEFAQSGSPIVFAFDFENNGCEPEDIVSFSFSVHNDREQGLFHYYSHFSDIYFKNIPPKGSFKCQIHDLALSPGNYLVMCRCVMNGDHTKGEEVDWPRVFIPLKVFEGDFFRIGSSKLSGWGPMLVRGEWSMEKYQ